MHDCASNFFPPSALSCLTEPDEEELCAAAAILSRSKQGGAPARSAVPSHAHNAKSEASAWPDDAVYISASHRDFQKELERHVGRGDRVIVLAGRAQVARRRAALAAGAHDILSTGTIEPNELAARICQLRSGSSLPPGIALNGEVLTLGKVDYPLTEREAQIMALLIGAKGRFVTLEAMLALWGPNASDAQYVRVAIRALRRRIEPERDLPRYLLSEPAIGYRLGPGQAVGWPPIPA